MSIVEKDNFDVAGEHTCFMCGRIANEVCAFCGEVWFCCETHGRLHYRAEEGRCFPWKVEEKEGVGRLMVTTKKVMAGETLFMEEPIVHGPGQEGFPVCMTCYELVSLDYLCPSCGYPMCDEVCANDPVHAEECLVLSRGDKPVFENEESEAYHCILPLRMVLLARNNPNRFNLADHLMDHEAERKGSKDWHTTERTVVHNLLQTCEGDTENGWNETEIRRAIGVLEVNSYEVNKGLRGCFPTASLLSHACIANSRHIWTHTAPFTNTCIASVDLEAGQEVLTTYQIPTTCTLRRRPNLREGWYFDCTCARCSSLTELGTNLNTMVCPRCDKPELRPDNPLLPDSVWKCSCGHEVPELEVKTIVQNIVNETKDLIENFRNNVNMWLDLENSSLKLVHPQHEVILEIAKWLVPVLCRSPHQVTTDFPISLVHRKLALAQSHLNVLNIVEPGFSKNRVKVLYEVVETELFLMFQDAPDVKAVRNDMMGYQIKVNEIINVLERLGPNEGFETIIFEASKNLLLRLETIVAGIEDNTVQLEECVDGWSLIELWRRG